MEIQLDRVRDEPFSWEERLTVAPASLERDEVVGFSEVQCRGRVRFVDPGFYLTAHLDYEQTLACTRCLHPTVEPVGVDVELLVLVERPGSAPHPGAAAAESELEEEELGVLIVEGERLDTEPILLEQLQLNIPMKPLCRPDCRGLCPVCGADRNPDRGEAACTCRSEETDPRWAALAGLKDRLDGDR